MSWHSSLIWTTQWDECCMTFQSHLDHPVRQTMTFRSAADHQDQGDHLYGKPGNVRDFDSYQSYVRHFTKSQGNVGEKILSGKSETNNATMTFQSPLDHPMRQTVMLDSGIPQTHQVRQTMLPWHSSLHQTTQWDMVTLTFWSPLDNPVRQTILPVQSSLRPTFHNVSELNMTV